MAEGLIPAVDTNFSLSLFRQRGDGFPLASMLTQVSVEQEDICKILEAHIYTVCPTAIPRLPDPAPDATEEELMKSLGMLKGSDGQYESFERFLNRTEVTSRLVFLFGCTVIRSTQHCFFTGHYLRGWKYIGLESFKPQTFGRACCCRPVANPVSSSASVQQRYYPATYYRARA